MNFELTEEQRKAIKSLERALKKCRVSNVVFADVEGSLIAYDGNVIDGPDPLSDEETDYPYSDRDNDGRCVYMSGYVFDTRYDTYNDYVQSRD